jgi:hypothetical protein
MSCVISWKLDEVGLVGEWMDFRIIQVINLDLFLFH